MRNVMSLRNGGCGPVVSRLSAGGVIAVGLCVAVLALSARGSEEETSGDRDSLRVGPNQGVSLLPEPRPADSNAEEDPALLGYDDSVATGAVEPSAAQVSPPAGTRMLKRRANSDEASGDSRGSPSPWYRTGLGALMIVLAIMGGLYYAVRRWVPSTRAADNGIVRVVGRTPLTPKHHVALVQLGRRYVAVGVSGDRIERLCEIDDAEEVADLAARVGAAEVRKGNGFDELLFRETSEYRDPNEGCCEEPRNQLDAVRARNRGPLKDLIRRLQKLNAK